MDYQIIYQGQPIAQIVDPEADVGTGIVIGPFIPFPAYGSVRTVFQVSGSFSLLILKVGSGTKGLGSNTPTSEMRLRSVSPLPLLMISQWKPFGSTSLTVLSNWATRDTRLTLLLPLMNSSKMHHDRIREQERTEHPFPARAWGGSTGLCSGEGDKKTPHRPPFPDPCSLSTWSKLSLDTPI